MPSATPRTRIIQVKSDKLHELLNAVAKRAYETGFKDAQTKARFDPDKTLIKEQSIWKIK